MNCTEKCPTFFFQVLPYYPHWKVQVGLTFTLLAGLKAQAVMQFITKLTNKLTTFILFTATVGQKKLLASTYMAIFIPTIALLVILLGGGIFFTLNRKR